MCSHSPQDNGKASTFVDYHFTPVAKDDFRTILSQDFLDVERVTEDASDDDDSLCAVEGRERH